MTLIRSRISPRGTPIFLLAVLLCSIVGINASPALGPYQTEVATTMLVYLAIAEAWNILAGFGGAISLGVTGFVGTGAYATGLLELHDGLGWLAALVLGTLVGGALAVILAFPLLRLRGDYFAIGTLAASLGLQAWLLNWRFAGGSTGLNIPVQSTPDEAVLYRVAVVVATVAIMVAIIVKRSRFGLRLMAVRDDEGAAAALGVSTFRHRLAAFVTSSVLISLAGGLVALQQGTFEPTGLLNISWTINALLMTIVGGIGTVTGPAVGAVVVYYLLTKQFETHATFGLIIEGTLLIIIVRYAPQGLWPTLTRTIRRRPRFGRRPERTVDPSILAGKIEASSRTVPS